MVTYRKYTWADPIERLMRAGAMESAEHLSDAVHLDTNGVVCFPGGYMHPNSFQQVAGEVAYQELLKRPRVQSEYAGEELEKCDLCGCRGIRSTGACTCGCHFGLSDAEEQTK